MKIGKEVFIITKLELDGDYHNVLTASAVKYDAYGDAMSKLKDLPVGFYQIQKVFEVFEGDSMQTENKQVETPGETTTSIDAPPDLSQGVTKERVAKVAHEINRAYCHSIGDNTQPDWENAPDWQKQSAINGVNFHLGNPDAGASASHDNWLEEKKQAGWKYGEVKNEFKKEHPCFLPYEKLPVSQKSKDYLFKQVVHSLKPFLVG